MPKITTTRRLLGVHPVPRAIMLAVALMLAVAMLLLGGARPAAASTHDGVIKLSTSSDRSSMIVCRSYPTCEQRATLFRGENTRTKFGWKDADAFYLPAGYNATVTPGIGRKTATGVQKLYGCNGCTRTVDLWRE